MTQQEQIAALAAERDKLKKALEALVKQVESDDSDFFPAMMEALACTPREEAVKNAGLEVLEGFEALAEYLNPRGDK